MQDEIVISVRDLRKKFKVYSDKGSSLKEKLLFFRRNKYENRWVLNGISFDLRCGEAVGLIGKNGCGKSTMLKLLTQIMYPTSGQLKIKGRVSSLIELGAGFHPDMSGRENIYTNASIFGLTKKEIDRRMEEIITFSELEEFIDDPVRTYSSGMYMRLAFSVAINVEADILLIDEILAVGDVSFQKKCFEKLKQIKRAGTSIIIVSHSLGQLEEICDRSIWIEDGRVRMEDEPKKVHKKYVEQMEKERMERIGEEYEKEELAVDDSEDEKISDFCGRKVLRLGKHQMYFSGALLTNSDHKPQNVFKTGDDLYAHFFYKNPNKIEEVLFCLRIYNEKNEFCFGTNTNVECRKYFRPNEEGTVDITLREVSLLKGRYMIDIDILETSGEAQDVIHEALPFYIENDVRRDGIIDITTTWKVDEDDIFI